MTIQDHFKKTPKELIFNSYNNIFGDLDREVFESLYETIISKELPKETPVGDSIVLRVFEGKDEDIYDISYKEEGNEKYYGISFMPWVEVLALYANPNGETMQVFLASLLHEMTFYGTEEEAQTLHEEMIAEIAAIKSGEKEPVTFNSLKEMLEYAKEEAEEEK